MSDTNEQIMSNAQFKKSLSIAFFNATNCAITLCSHMELNDETLKRITEIRDFFLEEHKVYYAKVIANIGQNYSTEESIKKLDATKTLDELKKVWINFSEDERQDLFIRAKTQELKAQYEKT